MNDALKVKLFCVGLVIAGIILAMVETETDLTAIIFIVSGVVTFSYHRRMERQEQRHAIKIDP